jgi:HK97 family phage major capsid protein
MAPPLDFSGVIPPEFSTQIIEEAVQASSVLRLAQLVPMGTAISQMPVPSVLPTASWTTGAGGRKAWTDLGLTTKQLTAEEVAAVTAIPDQYLEDSSINLWNWVRPRIAEAIALALDEAVLFGTNAPATFPAGGVDAVAAPIAASGLDQVETVNNAMAAVEGQGLNITGHAADLVVKSVLRGVRATTNELLLGTQQVGDLIQPTMYGVPIQYSSFSSVGGTFPDFFTGDWRALLIGVRQDIRYAMDPSAVIADDTGKVLISGFQDNTTPLKVWARFGCVILKPVTPRVPAGGNPFAKAALALKVTPTEASSGSGSQHAAQHKTGAKA